MMVDISGTSLDLSYGGDQQETPRRSARLRNMRKKDVVSAYFKEGRKRQEMHFCFVKVKMYLCEH